MCRRIGVPQWIFSTQEEEVTRVFQMKIKKLECNPHFVLGFLTLSLIHVKQRKKHQRLTFCPCRGTARAPSCAGCSGAHVGLRLELRASV